MTAEETIKDFFGGHLRINFEKFLQLGESCKDGELLECDFIIPRTIGLMSPSFRCDCRYQSGRPALLLVLRVLEKEQVRLIISYNIDLNTDYLQNSLRCCCHQIAREITSFNGMMDEMMIDIEIRSFDAPPKVEDDD